MIIVTTEVPFYFELPSDYFVNNCRHPSVLGDSGSTIKRSVNSGVDVVQWNLDLTNLSVTKSSV